MKKIILSSAITLALILVLMVPLTTSTASTDVTTLSGTVGSSITVTSPETITMPPLVAGTNVESVAQTVNVVTNTTSWSLEIADTGTDEHDGRLSKADGTDMSIALKIKGGDLSIYKDLSSSQTIKSAGTPGTINLTDIRFFQQVPSNAVTGEYSITLTFTATPGS